MHFFIIFSWSANEARIKSCVFGKEITYLFKNDVIWS